MSRSRSLVSGWYFLNFWSIVLFNSAKNDAVSGSSSSGIALDVDVDVSSVSISVSDALLSSLVAVDAEIMLCMGRRMVAVRLSILLDDEVCIIGRLRCDEKAACWENPDDVSRRVLSSKIAGVMDFIFFIQ